MKFKGISRRFSTADNVQYEAIGRFIDVCADIYGRDNICGLGYNWTSSSIEYVIGMRDKSDIDYKLAMKYFDDAVYKVVLLPDNGWRSYKGELINLSSFYDDIYKEGALTYELEYINSDGSFEVMINRERLKLSVIDMSELDYVMTLYRDALGQAGCVWDENYPNRDILENDILKERLYGFRDDDGRVVAAIAQDIDDEIAAFPFWTRELAPGLELARLVIASEYQNQGLARQLIICYMDIARKKGYGNVRFMVAARNFRAVHSYNALGFNIVGEADWHEEHYICYEKAV